MTLEKIKNRLSECCTHFLFEFNGKDCGVDPIGEMQYNVWFGEECAEIEGIDKLMETPFFDGMCLNDIYNRIKIISW